MAFEVVQSELGRLLGRGPWEGDVDSFVQELVSAFPALFKELPVAKVEAVATDTNPNPISIDDQTTSGDTPLMQIKRGGEVFNISINPVTGATSSDGGSPSRGSGSAAPSCFPGKVVSGTGDTYIVTIYLSGTSNPGLNVTVKQLQIAASETILPGAWTLVSKTADGSYWMQFPVWG